MTASKVDCEGEKERVRGGREREEEGGGEMKMDDKERERQTEELTDKLTDTSVARQDAVQTTSVFDCELLTHSSIISPIIHLAADHTDNNISLYGTINNKTKSSENL